ncbi:SigB/SigF/SigG family RNA polymerase sigma factor [Streptomyces sp. NPDC048349]|uniref:SigB/SigF/SigG family RNA polymerase sigma factor n=1 Tax=Streptomyces sp. NPDC048349 TaxID=3155486 RepID=UPI003418D25C
MPARAGVPRIARAHRLAPEDARELTGLFFTRLRSLPEGTPEYRYVRNTLIEMNTALVRFAARGFRKGNAGGAGAELEDIVQAGTIGLIKAIDRFDPERGVHFSTLALPYITGEIKRYFRDTTWAVRVPRRLKELSAVLTRAGEDLSATLGRAPTVREIARHLDLDEEEVVEGLVAANGYSTEPLDAPAGGEEHDAPRRASRTPADAVGESDPALELFEDLHSLGPLLHELSERDREILYLRFGREMTQSDIGSELGISQMQVSRLLTRILVRLRTGMLAA